MFCKFLLAVSVVFGASFAAFAGEVIELEYQYAGGHDVDFSSMPPGPLRIAEFTDSRNPNNEYFLAQVGTKIYTLSEPLPQVLRDALIRGFEAGGAELVEEGEQLVLSGELTEISGELNDDNIQLTLRAKVQLKKAGSGAQLYGTTLFGRGSAPASKGMDAAIADTLDELVNSLVWDDYFLMQVID